MAKPAKSELLRLSGCLGLAGVLTGAVCLGVLPPAAGLLALGVIVFGLFSAMGERVHEVVLVLAAVFAGTTVLMNPAPRVSPLADLPDWFFDDGAYDESLPVVLHLVFDELMSPGAIDGGLEGGEAVRRALYEMGERFGLRTYDSVYSRTFFTNDALIDLVNAEWSGSTALSSRLPATQSVLENAYFDDMERRGYRTIVFQSSLIDFCVNRSVDLCRRFPSYDPGVVKQTDRGLSVRAGQLAVTLLRAYEPSYLSRYGQRLFRIEEPSELDRDLGTQGRFDVHGFPSWFDTFTGFVTQVRRGTHVFAHFVVPHGPYLLTADCSLGENKGTGYYLARRYSGPDAREKARREHYANYFAQLSCVRSRIERFLEGIAGIERFHDAVVVIHGDHGSRISAGRFVDDFATEDYVANYGTYFAVRGPGVTPGVDCEFASLPEVFRKHVGGPSLPPLDRSRPPLVVETRSGGSPVEAEMPLFGCASRQEPEQGE